MIDLAASSLVDTDCALANGASLTAEYVVINFENQAILSSSNSERQAESLEPKVVCPFGLEIDENLYLHQLEPVSSYTSTDI